MSAVLTVAGSHSGRLAELVLHGNTRVNWIWLERSSGVWWANIVASTLRESLRQSVDCASHWLALWDQTVEV